MILEEDRALEEMWENQNEKKAAPRAITTGRHTGYAFSAEEEDVIRQKRLNIHKQEYF